MSITQTELPWTTSVQGKEYHDILEEVLKRPIVAWFSANKRCVHQLHKVTARLGDDLWVVLGHNYDDGGERVVTFITKLRTALRYLTKENGWTMCEFVSGRDFHQSVLDYLDA